jgi:4-hydroxy-3-methylbut-2-enyl diphosphate reductase
MRVIRAEVMGMCFGVRDALALVRSLDDPGGVTIHGELVHNEEVLRELAERGFAQTPEGRRHSLPLTERVVVTAHGISRRERRRLLAAGKELIDATCPLVRRVHDVATELQGRGYFVLVVGRPGHAEVEGVVGDLTDYAVVPDPDQVRVYDSRRLGVVCQSTTPPALAARVVETVRRLNPDKEVRFVDTICRPTRERQRAAAALAGRVQALVVVGGAQSNNTRQLAALAEARGVPVAHVRTARDLQRAWLARFQVVGLAAGTSTPDETIEEVYQALVDFKEGE